MDENGEFVKAINLEKDCGYIVKYSHSGRDLGYYTLGLRITTPDNRDMYLDFTGNGAPAVEGESIDTYPATVQSIDDLSEDIINIVLREGGMTREELAAEIAVDTNIDDEPDGPLIPIDEPLYVPASLDIVPPENPCAIFYTFKAPMAGVYQFAFSENVSGCAVVV
ncbi:MAG: hypothetical protein IJR85_07740 [Synergistaceae bacterium]|nr:hypothetical protein [Synergistaceae bacterium]